MNLAAAEEENAFLITAVASSTALARVIVLVGSKGARIAQLSYWVAADGLARISGVVITRPGRGDLLVGALARLIDVLGVEVQPFVEKEGHRRCTSLSTT